MAARRLVLDRSLAKSDVAQAGMAARRVKIRIRGAAFNRMYAESPALVLKMDALSLLPRREVLPRAVRYRAGAEKYAAPYPLSSLQCRVWNCTFPALSSPDMGIKIAYRLF